jgi:hypothetical protein
MKANRIASIVVSAACVVGILAPPAEAGQLPKPVFLYAEADGSPMRWDPCAAHSYVVNLGSLPPSVLSSVQAAMATIAKSTGIPWTYAGPTAAQVTDEYVDSSTFVKEDLGATLLISFQSPADGAMAIDGLAALSSVDIVPGSLWDWLDSGYLVLDPTAFSSVPLALRPAFMFQQLLPLMDIQASAVPGQVQLGELSASPVVPRPIVRALKAVGAARGCGKAPTAPANFQVHQETGSVRWESEPASDDLINVIGAYTGEVIADNGSSMIIESALGDVDVLSLLNEGGPTTLTLTVQAVSVAGRSGPVSHATVVYPG